MMNAFVAWDGFTSRERDRKDTRVVILVAGPAAGGETKASFEDVDGGRDGRQVAGATEEGEDIFGSGDVEDAFVGDSHADGDVAK